MSAGIVLEPFGGPGGLSEGGRMIGLRSIGIELDEWACRTRAAAGHLTIHADAAGFDVSRLEGRVTGCCGAPPCTTFSAAGSRAGSETLAELSALIRDMFAGRKTRAAHRRTMAKALFAANWPPPRMRPSKHDKDYKVPVRLTREQRSAAIWKAVRSASLVAEPARYIAACLPEWVALEQVPAVLPLWRVYADEMRKLGYSTWCGKVNAADYGIIFACPFHSDRVTPSCSHVSASAVVPQSVSETALAFAARMAVTTQSDAPAMQSALSAAHCWASGTRSAFAGAATCTERQERLAALVEGAAPRTPTGEAVAGWTSEATSGFALAAGTVANIASLLSGFLDELCYAEKSSTISTTTLRTITHLTSRSIAATLITGLGTGPASRTAGCGLCLDLSVPQTRERAILIASRVRRVSKPPPTHFDPRKGDQLFGRPWTSMAEALGWGADGRPSPAVTAGGTATGGAEPFGHRDRQALEVERDAGRWVLQRQVGTTLREGRRDHELSEPAPTITGGGSGAGSGNGAGLQWVLRTSFGVPTAGPKSTGTGSHGTHEMDPETRPAHTVTSKAKDWSLHRSRGASADRRDHPADEPAPAITGAGGKPGANLTWRLRSGQSVAGEGRAERAADEPSLAIIGRTDLCSWVQDRPATTVQGDPRIGRPGHKDRDAGEAQFAVDSVRITPEEAAALQSFPPGYPFKGTKTAVFQQIGNAVPPLLAAHVLAMASGLPLPAEIEGAA